MASVKMSYKTLLKLPDSKEKFFALERKLMQLQNHGTDFFEAKEEWKRLFEIYRNEGGIKHGIAENY